MKKILLCFLLLAIGVGAFAAYQIYRPTIDIFLESAGIDVERHWRTVYVQLAAFALLALPVAGSIFVIASPMSDEPEVDLHGYRVLRLRVRARRVFTVLLLAITGVFVFAASLVSNPLIAAILLLPAIFFFYGAIWLNFAKVRYDGSTIYVVGYLGGTQRYEWADLTEAVVKKEAMELRLKFRTGQTARISLLFSGIQDFADVIGELVEKANHMSEKALR